MADTVFDPLKKICARPLVINKANVDTDQIMPARFLTTTDRDGFGEYAFYDWRYDETGAPKPNDVLNATPRDGRRILLAGHNFGCGSSREHAPWGLYDYGVRVVLSTSIADIFKNNCLKNGIAAIEVAEPFFDIALSNPDAEICVDLGLKMVSIKDRAHVEFDMDELGRQCLMRGEDQLGLLLKADKDIEAFEVTCA